MEASKDGEEKRSKTLHFNFRIQMICLMPERSTEICVILQLCLNQIFQGDYFERLIAGLANFKEWNNIYINFQIASPVLSAPLIVEQIVPVRLKNYISQIYILVTVKIL